MSFNEQYLIYERLPLIDVSVGKKRIRLLYLKIDDQKSEGYFYSKISTTNRIKVLENDGSGRKYTFKTEKI